MSQHAKLLETVATHFSNTDKWALVIGDLMLDRYMIGEVERISPEAPVPVVLIKHQEVRAGGAANVAANLAQLGIPTSIAGCIGQDSEAEILLSMLGKTKIQADAVFKSIHRPTVTKTRILGGHQQMVRLDQESRESFSSEESNALLTLITKQLERNPAIVLLSDYAKGVLSPNICSSVIDICKSRNIPVLVDPKGKDFSKYRGATALTPNKKETAEACGVNPRENEPLLKQASELANSLGLKFLAVTRGEEGISLIEENLSPKHLPATAKQVFDVSGAGDTVIATLAAGLVHGLTPSEALTLANIAAGIVVGKVGTVPIEQAELIQELSKRESSMQADKVCSLETLHRKVSEWRQNGEKIVFTNGCFDLLHAGHVTYLEEARLTGDRLILGLNTDRSVSTLKGPTRPVIHEADRARVLAALESVDAVILFDEDTPLNLINSIRPDVIVKGSDYREDQVIGGNEVKSWGGKIALIPVVPGRSTSNIIEKLAS